jgi:hypothetical protein
MHRFVPDGEYPDGAWCTAQWVRIGTGAERDCLAGKHARFGMARFIDELPLEVQVEIANETEARRD